MTWVKLDDQFADHPKIAGMGSLAPLAGWLHVCALCYCARYLTDGFIPAGQVQRLASFEGTDVQELVAALIDVGLWERAERGYQVHDYLEYNPTRESVEAERQQARERMQNLRKCSGEVRANNSRSSVTPVPVPVPLPVPKTRTPEEEELTSAKPADAITLYHDLCPSLPRIRECKGARADRLRRATARLGPDGIRELFARAGASDFLCGHLPGKTWKADFDWLLKPEHIPRVLEGSYDNRNGNGAVPANVANALALVERCEQEEAGRVTH